MSDYETMDRYGEHAELLAIQFLTESASERASDALNDAIDELMADRMLTAATLATLSAWAASMLQAIFNDECELAAVQRFAIHLAARREVPS